MGCATSNEVQPLTVAAPREELRAPVDRAGETPADRGAKKRLADANVSFSGLDWARLGNAMRKHFAKGTAVPTGRKAAVDEVTESAKVVVEFWRDCGLFDATPLDLHTLLFPARRFVGGKFVVCDNAAAATSDEDGLPLTIFLHDLPDYTDLASTCAGMAALSDLALHLNCMMAHVDVVVGAALEGANLLSPAASGARDDDGDDDRYGQERGLKQIALDIFQQIFRQVDSESLDAIASMMAVTEKGQLRPHFGFEGTVAEDALRKINRDTIFRVRILQVVVSTGITVNGLFGGGRYNSPLNARFDSVRAHSAQLSALVSAFWQYCANPQRGMEAVSAVDEKGVWFGVIAAAFGLVNSRVAGALDSWIGWSPRIPMSVLYAHAQRVVLSVQMLVNGQRKVALKDVSRSDVMRIVTERALSFLVSNSPDDQVSARLFPAFRNEPGEGHGPRKEFFETVAKAFQSVHSPPDVLRESFVFHGEEGRGALEWQRDASTAIENWIAAGDSMLLTFASGNAATSFSCNVDAISSGARKGVVVVRVSPPCPATGKFALMSVRKRQAAILASDDVVSDVWFSPAIDEAACEGGEREPSARELGSTSVIRSPFPQGSLLWVQQRHAALGWCMGTAVANGVALPVPLPTVQFKFLLWRALAGRNYRAAPGRRPLPTRYVPTEGDLVDMRPSYAAHFARIRAMSDAERAALLEGDEELCECLLGRVYERLPPTTAVPTADDIIQQGYVRRLLVAGCRERVHAVLLGVEASGLLSTPSTPLVSPGDMREVVCGSSDDGEGDFSFASYFDVVFDDEFGTYRHTVVFRRLLVEVLEGRYIADARGSARFKRGILRFITGCERLPSPGKTDRISVHFAMACYTIGDCHRSVQRLPAAHTCTNDFEVPNYLEALMFIATSGGQKPNTIISEDDRESRWAQLSEKERSELRRQAAELLQRKLQHAAENAGTYELDEEQHTPLRRGPLTVVGAGPAVATAPLHVADHHVAGDNAAPDDDTDMDAIDAPVEPEVDGGMSLPPDESVGPSQHTVMPSRVDNNFDSDDDGDVVEPEAANAAARLTF